MLQNARAYACMNTYTNTHTLLYFNLWFGSFIIFRHEPLLPLPCLHSNTIATPFVGPALDLNPTHPASLSPLHLSSVAERIVHQTEWQLLLRHAWPVHLFRRRPAGEGRVLECRNQFTWTEEQAKWCNTPTADTHTHIHHLRATCINPSTESFIALTPGHPCSSVMYNRQPCQRCLPCLRGSCDSFMNNTMIYKSHHRSRKHDLCVSSVCTETGQWLCVCVCVGAHCVCLEFSAEQIDCSWSERV